MEKLFFLTLMCIHYNGPISASKSFKYDTSPHNFTGYLHLPALVGFLQFSTYVRHSTLGAIFECLINTIQCKCVFSLLPLGVLHIYFHK